MMPDCLHLSAAFLPPLAEAVQLPANTPLQPHTRHT